MAHESADSGPTCSLDEVLITDELARRPSRPSDFEAESRALGALAQVLAEDPRGLLQAVVEAAMRLCRADSAGVSILEPGGTCELFRWHATAGALAALLGGTIRREASPCGEVLTREAVLLFDRAERHFPALRGVGPAIYEGLLSPLQVNGEAIGTLWVIGHTPDRRFDAEDARLLTSLARFAAAAWQTVTALEAARARREELEHRVAERTREVSNADAALRASEERHRLIVEGARDYAIFTTDPDGHIESWSPGAEAVFGWSAQEAMGQLVDITFTPEDRAEGVPRKEEDVARREGCAPNVRWHVRNDGSRVFIDGVTRALHDDAGAVRAFLKVGQDVTQRRRMEETLRESEARFRGFFENAAVGMAQAEIATGRLLRVNDALCRITGYREDELLGRTFRDITHPEDAGVELAASTTSANLHYEVEKRLVCKNGEPIWARINVGVVRNADGTPMRTAAVVEDVTDRKRAEEALRKAHDELELRVAARTAELARANDELRAEVRERQRSVRAQIELTRRLATAQEDERRRVARDLHDHTGQLLAGLSLAVQAVHAAGPLPPAAADRLREVQHIADDLGQQVHALALQLRPTALDDLGLASALRLLVSDFAARARVSIDFQTTGLEGERLPSDVETVLYRVVQEALTNVARHARAQHVSVVVSRHEGQAIAVVEDDGSGFEPGEAGVARLGLVGMRERVTLAGGELEVETTVGAGTTILARVPLPVSEAPGDGT